MSLTSTARRGYSAAMLFPRTLPAAGVALITATAFAASTDPFAEGVRPTDPLAPEEEAKSFHLPPGFEIQLFAAEPQINKPINMAFDTKGTVRDARGFTSRR